MSRIGNKEIIIPQNVQVELGSKVVVKGPKGELSLMIPSKIVVEKKEAVLRVSRKDEDKESKSLHGLIRSLIANMVVGVTDGYKKTLELSGIGFRANLTGNKLVLNVGFSHLVEIEPSEGVTFAVSGNKIAVSGIDKEVVGRVAAQIRKVRPPDAYKGKGIKYEGEVLRLKPGKAAKAGVGATT